MKVFLDASALVPWVAPRDQWRPRLFAIVRTLRQEQRTSFCSSTWTYYEALAIANRSGRESVARLRQFMVSEASLAHVDVAIEAQALDRFFAWSDKTASVVDHANLLMAQRLGCQAILSFDNDFVPIASGAGIRLLR